ncbi:centrosomal protein of 135 kDa [Pectinophora gossypiella]|uniref:centrosomal protein of 135 kDa n=1 Tax=Pectinophora gossypiella TaxID=13191 RepID=UPI00214E8311|nr:centrosomal protein of 135 kDa [Pectinophora gossypiella]
MGEPYFNLKLKLEELGYNNTLPIDAVPLVECILADLLQTTRSLQHYMNLSKDALKQRDVLMLEAEPYKCENAKLIQENSHLHRELIEAREEYERLTRETKRKIKSMTEEIMKKDALITKLQHDLRDMSLRGLCADTQSSRNKSKKKEVEVINKACMCNESKNYSQDTIEITRKMSALEHQNEEYSDEIALLKSQIEHRDNEIIRLNILLEGGRPITAINKDCCKLNTDAKIEELKKQLTEVESSNDLLKKELDSGLEKQHEAMLRALNLADKNKCLQEELRKVDALALKVEEDCNKRLSAMMNDINLLQARIENLSLKNSQLERELSRRKMTSPVHNGQRYQESLTRVMIEKEALQKEIKDLVELNKNLQDKIEIFSQDNTELKNKIISECQNIKESKQCPTKAELHSLLEEERKKYELHIIDIQTQLTETMHNFNKHLSKCKDRDVSPKRRINASHDNENAFVKHLHKKLCDCEQKILTLKKENDELKSKTFTETEGNKQNYKDIISQLNAENAELSKENISLSQRLSHYKNTEKCGEVSDNHFRREVSKLQDQIESLTHEIQILRKDKQEYNLRYKDALEMTDKLKRDLACKQKEIERLEEENCSYKMSTRTGKASADHLRDECHFLREQIKRMQSDVIKEKTLASQIKNIQLETERSSNEIQNELLCTQKKLTLSTDKIEALERKCKELQSEISTLKNDKSNLIDNIKKVDQERDKLIIELDHKTENMCVLEQKMKSQAYEINRLESEVSELQRKLNVHKVSEHKIVDNEAQITFLNGEISRLQQKLDGAIIENKHLQNSLADANGNLKIIKIEYEKSRKEVDGLKQQLQHYVAEIRRIEEMLSHKEAERSDMLEQFASLSVEANILENTNHSLESESASKSLQLQTYINKIENLESKLLDKDNIIDSQSTRIAALTCKVTSLENEIKLITEEKTILEQNVSYLKQMCNNLHSEHASMTTGMCETDSELKLYENKIKSLTKAKSRIEVEKNELRESLKTTEKLLSNARNEIVELKLALQDATDETKSLQERLGRLSRREETELHTTLTKEELELPLMLEETIHEVSHEEDEDSLRYHEVRKRFSKYTHGSTL